MDWTEQRIGWRDALLDELARHLGRNKDTAQLGRRLTRYLENARAIEDQQDDGDDSRRRLAEWTAERLPEIARQASESALRGLRLRWDTLERTFRDRPVLRVGEPRGRPADWYPLVEEQVRLLKRFGGRRLTKSERDEAIATEQGRVRAPRAMALHLLFLACRTEREGLKDFRRKLERVALKPPVL